VIATTRAGVTTSFQCCRRGIQPRSNTDVNCKRFSVTTLFMKTSVRLAAFEGWLQGGA